MNATEERTRRDRERSPYRQCERCGACYPRNSICHMCGGSPRQIPPITCPTCGRPHWHKHLRPARGKFEEPTDGKTTD